MAKGRKSTILATLGGGAIAGPGGAAIGYAIAKGQAHRKADKFRETYQDPFGERVGKILDPLDAARNAGTLNLDQVKEAQTKFEGEVSQFTKDALNYEMLGGDQQRVVGQAWDTLNPIIATWRSTFDKDLQTLTPKTTAGEPPTAGSLLAPLGQTPAGQARQSASMEAKRARAQQGRQSTILTGSGVPDPVLKKTTLLGY